MPYAAYIQARSFAKLYDERGYLVAELESLRAAAGRPAVGRDGTRAGRPAAVLAQEPCYADLCQQSLTAQTHTFASLPHGNHGDNHGDNTRRFTL